MHNLLCILIIVLLKLFLITPSPALQLESNTGFFSSNRITSRVVYLPGKDNPTDYLSRHPVDSYSLHNCKQAEAYVNFISHFATPKAMSLSEIKHETASDPTMQKLAKLIRTKCWYLLKNSSYTEKLHQVNVDVNELTLF